MVGDADDLRAKSESAHAGGNWQYERRLKQYEVDQKLLAELEGMAGSKARKPARKPARARTPRK